jgi:hypothetical protein
MRLIAHSDDQGRNRDRLTGTLAGPRRLAAGTPGEPEDERMCG